MTKYFFEIFIGNKEVLTGNYKIQKSHRPEDGLKTELEKKCHEEAMTLSLLWSHCNSYKF